MNIFERLTKDHEIQRKLARQLLKTSGDSAKRRDLFSRFRSEVAAHASAEEQTLYAALFEKPDGQEKARHSVTEHKEAADLLKELGELEMSNGGWLHKFEKLHKSLEHHLKEEEEEVFVLAKRLIDEQRALQLANEFDKRKKAEAA